MIINLILYFIFILFFIFLSLFLYNGSNIYELISYSNFDYIYMKIDNDFEQIIKNRSLQFIIPESSNNIYKTKINFYSNSINSEVYFYINNTLHKLNIYNDISKIVPILINFKNKFNYNEQN